MNTIRLLIAIYALSASIAAAEIPPRYEVGTLIQCGHILFEIKEVLASDGTPQPLGYFRYRVAINGLDGLLEADELRLDLFASEGKIVKPAQAVPTSESPAPRPVRYKLGQIIGPAGSRFQIQGWRSSLTHPGFYTYKIVGAEQGDSGIAIECDEALLDGLSQEKSVKP